MQNWISSSRIQSQIRTWTWFSIVNIADLFPNPAKLLQIKPKSSQAQAFFVEAWLCKKANQAPIFEFSFTEKQRSEGNLTQPFQTYIGPRNLL